MRQLPNDPPQTVSSSVDRLFFPEAGVVREQQLSARIRGVDSVTAGDVDITDQLRRSPCCANKCPYVTINVVGFIRSLIIILMEVISGSRAAQTDRLIRFTFEANTEVTRATEASPELRLGPVLPKPALKGLAEDRNREAEIMCSGGKKGAYAISEELICTPEGQALWWRLHTCRQEVLRFVAPVFPFDKGKHVTTPWLVAAETVGMHVKKIPDRGDAGHQGGDLPALPGGKRLRFAIRVD